MPPNLDYVYEYQEDLPIIPVRVISHETAAELVIEALIDTGSDLTILDAEVGRVLGLDFTALPTVRFRGIVGDPADVPVTEVELLPLFEPDLSVTLRVAFAPRIPPGVDNLIGRDILAYLDFGLSHSEHLLFLGPAEI